MSMGHKLEPPAYIIGIKEIPPEETFIGGEKTNYIQKLNQLCS